MNTQDIILTLRRFHNVVLEGVPGTGKTLAVSRVARTWKEATGRELGSDGSGEAALTLHPSTAYEDFIEGLRPQAAGQGQASASVKVVKDDHEMDTGSSFMVPAQGGTSFTPQDGFFLRLCARAAEEPERDFLVLLDELNRANVPKVIGDLLSTLEHSKRARWDDQKQAWDVTDAAVVSLPYSGRSFFVPENVYVLATMNTSDRSVATLDAALRRRFSFVRLEPWGVEEVLAEAKSMLHRRQGLEDAEATAVLQDFSPSIEVWERLNSRLLLPCLGPDAVLGHSYMFGMIEAYGKLTDATARAWRKVPELARLLDALNRGQSPGGAPFRRVIWLETGTTGGSENQADLPKGGQHHPAVGQPHLLLDLSRDPDLEQEYTVRVRHGGTWTDSVVKYWGGERSNKMWRWQQMPSGLTSQLVLLFDLGNYEFEAMVIPPTAKDALRAVSDWDRGAISPKTWGTLKADRIPRQQPLESTLVQQTWRFEVLPQLIETLIGMGAELLVDPDRRDQWFESHDLDEETKASAREALTELDQFLGTIGLSVTVPGTGLGRMPRVSVG